MVNSSAVNWFRLLVGNILGKGLLHKRFLCQRDKTLNNHRHNDVLFQNAPRDSSNESKYLYF